eukprot:TRINITY_DN6907_c0_g1_i1.p1 TRINITY_DN6907_c0_g1~~TRINITY_DN6907_c0_g1_i1.p1  ORF type:complete len:375 (+),score=45.25 TRINITY_DN6907_c0_g1_i1:448-1572(+)
MPREQSFEHCMEYINLAINDHVRNMFSDIAYDRSALKSVMINGKLKKQAYDTMKDLMGIVIKILQPTPKYLNNLPLDLFFEFGAKILKEFEVTVIVVDGNTIIYGSSEGFIQICDKFNGVVLKTLIGHTRWISGITIHENMLVSSSWDNTVRVWDKNLGVCFKIVEGQSTNGNCVLVDGNNIISGDKDCNIKIWDQNTAVCQRSLSGHTDFIECLVLLGNNIFSGSLDATIRIWDKNSGDCLQVLKGHGCCVTCLCIDKFTLISGSQDHQIRFWDTASGNCLKRVCFPHEIYSMGIYNDSIFLGAQGCLFMLSKDSYDYKQLKGYNKEQVVHIAVDKDWGCVLSYGYPSNELITWRVKCPIESLSWTDIVKKDS